MSFYFLLKVFALCVLALLVAADSPNHAEIHGRSTIKTANKLSCIKSDVSLVKKEVSHPLEFCKFYLSELQMRYRILNCCFRSKGSADFNSKNPRVDQIIEHCKASHIKYSRIYSASHFVIQSCDGAGLCVQNLTITSRNEVVNLGGPFFDNLWNRFGDTRSPHRVRIYRDICFFIAGHSIADFWFFCFHSIQIV
ncbi:hypothetical protein D6D24_06519 [Aureobasidium pullulans]|uniref:Cyanovirin-N domain-containing protein n=1 Tax=Aureobasidium pullulans TaxID=5580 RepID=A0A4S8VKM8_AURPU|nr:hypothetical protein D6D24_06519 [Aureobasidium pullulans]